MWGGKVLALLELGSEFGSPAPTYRLGMEASQLLSMSKGIETDGVIWLASLDNP